MTNRRDLQVEGGAMRGQCFLCTRVLVLTPAFDSAGTAGYACPRCGGMNSAARIEAGLNIDKQPVRL